MRKIIKTGFIGLCLLATVSATAQDKKKIAQQKCNEAVELMDKGDFEASFKLLDEAKKLDPSNLNIEYETAFAFMLQKDYKKAIKKLESIKGNKNFDAPFYGILGNSYDYDCQSQKALDVYNEGLKKYPKSGKLHLEKGVAYLGIKDYDKALETFEKGIEAEPVFPSNYYWASKLWLSTDNEIWGMLYGEIFMNMERNSARTAEISKLLYKTYKSEIKFTSDTSASVSFAKNVLQISKKPNEKQLMAALYPNILEADLAGAVGLEKSIDLASLNRIRQNFLNIYFEKNHHKTYPNVLFDYQKELKDTDQLEAYNYWLLMKGDEPAFETWKEANPTKWKNFTEWFTQYPLVITEKSRFLRTNTSL